MKHLSIKVLLSVALPTVLALAAIYFYHQCSHQEEPRPKTLGFTDKTLFDKNCTMILSDDSLVAAFSWNMRDGGTAPDIETVIQFKNSKGDVKEERTPLLKLAEPECDWSHHEVDKIVSVDGDFGERTYYIFLSAKEGSFLYTHDLVAFRIEGDKFVPHKSFIVGGDSTSHISLEQPVFPSN